MMIKRLFLDLVQWERMRAHVQSCMPMEGCGLLAGTGDSVCEVFPIDNREQSMSRFRMDAAEQLRAFRAMEEGGMELLAIFHSHPADARAGEGPADEPSATDVHEAAYPAVQVIWSRHAGQWRARGFWIENARVTDVPLHIIAGQ
ncbi:MAG: M67 family metallopeptidase [Chloroflexota bacterium]